MWKEAARRKEKTGEGERDEGERTVEAGCAASRGDREDGGMARRGEKKGRWRGKPGVERERGGGWAGAERDS